MKTPFVIVKPLRCFISLINKKFPVFIYLFFFFGQYFHLPITVTPCHSTFFSRIICAPSWRSFVAGGSFAVQYGDHLRSRDNLRRCTAIISLFFFFASIGLPYKVFFFFFSFDFKEVVLAETLVKK